MRAEETGVDLADPEVQKAFVDEQLRDVLDRETLERPEPTDHAPPIPIVETAPKIGRNAPCPCGSGRKYKKCCGRPAAEQRQNS